MKRALPLYSIFLILTANVAPVPPVSAESIGDRSNRQAYADAPSRNWVDRLITTPSSSTAYEYRGVRREPAPVNPWWLSLIHISEPTRPY